MKKFFALLLTVALVLSLGMALASCGDEAVTVVDVAVEADGSIKVLYSDGTDKTIGNIDDYAFSNTGLVSVTMPNSITTLGDRVFYDCYDLKTVVFSDNLVSIGESLFGEGGSDTTEIDGMFFLGSKNNPKMFLCSLKDDKATSATIPAETKFIMDYAFYDCDITSITIPNGVLSIGRYAFEDCYDLASVVIPDSVKSLAYGAFEDCDKLTSVKIPEGITEIPGNCFSGCEALASVTLPSTLTKIGEYAFSGCAFTSIEIPAGVTEIAPDAFYNCSKLTSFTFPAGVTRVSNYVLSNCKSLETISIPAGITSIGYEALYSCSALKTVNFAGTKTQLEAIDKDSDWNAYVPAFTVKCSDCDVKVPKGPTWDW